MGILKRSRKTKRGSGGEQGKGYDHVNSGVPEVEEASQNEAVDGPIGNPVGNTIVQSLGNVLEPEPDETLAGGFEVSDPGEPCAAEAHTDSSMPIDPEPDDSTRFQILDAVIGPYRSIAVEAEEPVVELIDPSKWFEHSDYNSHETTQEASNALYEDPSSEFACIEILDAAVENIFSSTTASSDEPLKEVVDSTDYSARATSKSERRKHRRENSSDLVWVEYFNSSMESAGKEAARVENIGAGGMRVVIKNAPPELEKVIVSYPFRGFESCTIVRGRFQGQNGQEHLCLEFADKAWNVTSAPPHIEDINDQVTTGKILLADDDSAFRRILGNILVKAGYDVVLAEDGEKALEKAASENPDLVITDALMPKLHGFEVCKAIKQTNPRAKVIMLTAVYRTPNYIWEAKAKFGADEILTKPCEISVLLSKIEKHIGTRLVA